MQVQAMHAAGVCQQVSYLLPVSSCIPMRGAYAASCTCLGSFLWHPVLTHARSCAQALIQWWLRFRLHRLMSPLSSRACPFSGAPLLHVFPAPSSEQWASIYSIAKEHERGMN
jgi:hypothetical protein